MKELLHDFDMKEEGRREGIQQGEHYFSLLVEKLLEANRNDDLLKATTDTDFRKKLYEEFSILP